MYRMQGKHIVHGAQIKILQRIMPFLHSFRYKISHGYRDHTKLIL